MRHSIHLRVFILVLFEISLERRRKKKFVSSFNPLSREILDNCANHDIQYSTYDTNKSCKNQFPNLPSIEVRNLPQQQFLKGKVSYIQLQKCYVIETTSTIGSLRKMNRIAEKN